VHTGFDAPQSQPQLQSPIGSLVVHRFESGGNEYEEGHIIQPDATQVLFPLAVEPCGNRRKRTGSAFASGHPET
jgi:hypothetical protein